MRTCDGGKSLAIGDACEPTDRSTYYLTARNMGHSLKFLTSTVYLSAAEGKLYDLALGTASSIHQSVTGVQHVAHFADKAYSRSSFVFLGDSESIFSATAAFARTIFENASLQKAQSAIATHPTLGLLDHICVQPLEGDGMATAADIANRAAEHVAADFRVPCFVYGVPGSPSLADIRRRSGRYFHATGPISPGPGPSTTPDSSTGGTGAFVPRYGPHSLRWPEDGGVGVCCIGAASYVLNYNIPIQACVGAETDAVGLIGTGATDQSKIAQVQAELGALVKLWARQISTRGGGLPSVEAMGLLNASSTHALPGAQPGPGALSRALAGCDGTNDAGQVVTWEIACNLLDPDVVTPERVLERVEQLVAARKIEQAAQEAETAAVLHVSVGTDYIIGLTKQQLRDKAEKIRAALNS